MEQKRQRELNEIVQVVQRFEREKETLRMKQSREREKAVKGTGSVNANAYRRLVGEWIEWADEDIERIERETVLLNFEADRRRVVLAEAARATLTLEKLKEKEEADYREREKKEEQKLFDELALRGFSLGRRAAKDSGRQERNAR